MNNEEAIEILKGYKQRLEASCSNQLEEDKEAFDLAIKALENASTVSPTIEPRIEYGTDGQPYRLFMSGGKIVPDVLQGWRYEE